MNRLVKRESLVGQLVEALKRELSRFSRTKWLPGERELSRQFQVSRKTMRAALAKMQRQGLVHAYPQLGYKILSPAHMPRAKSSRLICCLQGLMPHESLPQFDTVISAMEHRLGIAGYELKIFRGYSMRGGDTRQKLANLVKAYPAACWLITTVSFEVQKWFMKQGLSVLLLGSCYSGIALPNMDICYGAIGRHAAGLLWRLGHRRICILTPRIRFGGDIDCEKEFIGAVQQLSKGTVSVKILRHNGSPSNICSVLGACFFKEPAPTAILVIHSVHALTALSFLVHKGFRVPQEISLVCRDDDPFDPFLEHVIPPIAHYKVNWPMFVNRSVRAIIQLATAGCLKAGTRWAFAQYCRNGTVAPPPFNARR